MKRIVIASLITLAGHLSVAQFSGGTGVQVDPYLISTKNDLKTLSENPTYWGAAFLQTADIYFVNSDFSVGGAFYNGGSGFITIGNLFTSLFTGVYDGGNYMIDGIKIYRPSQNYVGVFGETSNCTIKNVNLTNVNITGGVYVAGMAAVLENNSLVSNCSVTGVIQSNYYVGGICAVLWTGSTINNSYGRCTVSGGSRVGGLVGETYQGSVNRSYASGAVNGSQAVGGIVGDHLDQSAVTNCFSWVNVNGDYGAGGLVGEMLNNSTVTNSYSTGMVTGIEDFGGLVGYIDQGTVTNSYWDTITSHVGVSAGGTGVPTAFLQQEMNLLAATWDYVNETTNGTDDYWYSGQCVNNTSYPLLTWMQAGLGALTALPTPYVTGNLYSCGSTPATVHGGSVFTHFWSTQQAPADSIDVAPTFTSTYWLLDMSDLGCYSDTLFFTVTSGNTGSTISPVSCGSYTSPSGLNTYTVSGTYSDVITNAAGCDSIITINLTIPVIDASVTTNDPSISAVAAGADYQWIDCGNGNQWVAGETGQTFTASANGSYAVIVTVNGCADTSACQTIQSVGLSNNGLSIISIAPNPTNDFVTVAFNRSYENLEFRVYSATGTLQSSQMVATAEEHSLQLPENAGVYFVVVSSNGTQLLNERVLKM